jgi:hypothetical protein
VALVAGPLVLMRLTDADSAPFPIRRGDLLAAQRDANGGHQWQAKTDAGAGAGAVKLKPFLDIAGETYSAYQTVLPS